MTDDNVDKPIRINRQELPALTGKLDFEQSEWANQLISDDVPDPAALAILELVERRSQLLAALAQIAALQIQVKAYREALNTPETEDFFKGVPLEAAHQRVRWGSDHDGGKTPPDWFWLVGYLAGKCLAAHIAGNIDKALHHTISTAAALANWHMAIKGAGDMRPGIETPKKEPLDEQR
jgi:hypothetical protein